MRHCYDFADGGSFHGRIDLSANVRGEMVGFVKRELLAQRVDASAVNARCGRCSLRPSRPWIDGGIRRVAEQAQWMRCAHWVTGRMRIPFLRRTQAAIYEGVYAQAHEFLI